MVRSGVSPRWCGAVVVRPVASRNDRVRNDGHTLVVILAYLIVRRLWHARAELDMTVKEGPAQLTSLWATQAAVGGEVRCSQIASGRRRRP
jgi:hypothetical protein